MAHVIKQCAHKKILLHHSVIHMFVLFLTLLISHNAFAICAATQNKKISDMPAVECPTFTADHKNADGTAAPWLPCAPSDYANVQPNSGGNVNTGIGAITSCILSGDDPPVEVRPDYGHGLVSSQSASHFSKCPPSQDGTVNCPLAVNTTMTGFIKQLPRIDTPIPALPGLNTPPICISIGNPIKISCGGAVPLFNGFTTITSDISIGNAFTINLEGGDITLGAPSPNTPPTTMLTINNSLAPSQCQPSSLQIPGDKISLIVPSSNGLTVSGGSVRYASQGGILNLPPGDAIKFALDDTNGDIIKLPKGGQFVIINGDIDGDVVAIPAGGSVVSLGNGQFVLPLQGPEPPSNGTNFSFAYKDINGNADTVTVDQTYFQQTIAVPQNYWPIVQAWDKNGGLPAGAVKYTYTTDPQTNQQVLTGMTLKGLYLNDTDVSVDNKMIIKASALTAFDSLGNVLNINLTVATGSVVPPQGSVLNLPSGTPLSFAINKQGSITLPNGGNITAPTGSTITTATSSGTTTTLTTAAQTVNIGSNNTATSNGAFQLTITPSNTVVAFPRTTDPEIAISTTEIAIPNRTNTPIPVDPGGAVVVPQSAGYPDLGKVCIPTNGITH